MIPILYDSYETSFRSNGLGRLADAVSCIVTEERNGVYELEMKYPVTGRFYSQLIEGGIIGSIHDDRHDVQPFEIYSYTAPIEGLVTFYAHHLSYRLNQVMVRPYRATSAAQAMAQIVPNSVNDNPFTFWTDKAVSGEFNLTHPQAARALLGGVRSSILDTYGKGEYQFDKWEVKLYRNRGVDSGVTIRYGKNLTNLTHSVDRSNSFSAIAPYWIGGEGDVVYLPEIYVVSPVLQVKKRPWITEDGTPVMDGRGNQILFGVPEVTPVPMDFSGDFEEAPTAAQLRARAFKYLEDNEPWLPDENITLDFVQLWQTEEYEAVASLQRLALCDTVSVFYPELGVIADKRQVIRVVYNTLLERYDSMEVGKPKASLASTLMGEVSDRLDQLESKTNGMLTASKLEPLMDAAIADATQQITGGLGGYVVLKLNADGQPEELLIMDTPDVNTAVNVWRFNQGGLGHSHTGYNGPFSDIALTQDGKINAAMITTGILNASLIRAGVLQDVNGVNYWNLETGEFRLAAYATTTAAQGYASSAESNAKTAAQGYANTAESNAKGYADTASAAAVNAQTQQFIFNKLTNNGQTQGIYLQNGKLYINATYMQTGMISDTSGKNYWNLETGQFQTKQGTIGFMTVTDTALTAANSTIDASGIRYNGTGGYGTKLETQGLAFYHDNTPIGILYGGPASSTVDLVAYRAGSVLSGTLVFNIASSGIVVLKDFTVRGTKNRCVQTEDYGDVLLSAYETPSPMFGDVGEGVIGEDRRCTVWLDPVFAETICTDQYQVFLSPYGEGDCYVSERRGSYFTISGTPGLAFGWEIKAKQRGYDQRRLEKFDEWSPSSTDYGELGANYYQNLIDGRKSA